MLDMLLTADAAHKHGNEPMHSPSSLTTNGSFLVQMPLSIIGSVLRCQSPALPPAGNSTALPPDATAPQQYAMNAAPDTPQATPTPSRPASSSSSAADEQPIRRAPRSKTSYIYARPAKPIDTRPKLHIRPKVLLQLHEIIPSQRPRPAYEVVPFPLLPAKSTRRLARTFNTRERLGAHDLLVVKAEAYGTKDDEAKSDDDRWGSREVVGVICPAKNDKGVTEICMDDGSSRWAVTAMANGGFEFNTTDDHGLTLKARWVLKPAHARRVSAMSAVTPLSPTLGPVQDDQKYTFSTISANSRRHPIIATMTRSRIDIMDSYAIPSATSPPTPGSLLHSPTLTPASIDIESFIPKDQLPIDTDDALRRFILVTGVWVASQGYHSSKTCSLPPTPSETAASSRPSNTRTVSMSVLDSPRSASPASTLEEKRRSFPRLLRSMERLPRSTSFTSTSPHPPPTSSPTPPPASPSRKTRSRRANSTGTNNLLTTSGSMRRRHGLAFEGQAPAESEEERQIKRSVELLRIKELVLPERSSSDVSTNRPPIPSAIITRPSTDAPPPRTPPSQSSQPLDPSPARSRKAQSTYNPTLTTAGLWDSSLPPKPRPTSMSFFEKRQERKRERDSVSIKKGLGEWARLKIKVKGLFGRGGKV